MKEEIILYLEKKQELETLEYSITIFAKTIFNYCKENHIGLLSFDKYSTYESWKIKDRKFSIKFFDRGYDIYEYSYIRIPMNRIDNNTWKEYLQEQDTKRINKIIAKEQEEAEIKKQKELQLLKELKEKYEI